MKTAQQLCFSLCVFCFVWLCDFYRNEIWSSIVLQDYTNQAHTQKHRFYAQDVTKSFTCFFHQPLKMADDYSF